MLLTKKMLPAAFWPTAGAYPGFPYQTTFTVTIMVWDSFL